MDNKDFLILTKGLAVCLVLDTAVGLLNEIAFEVSSTDVPRRYVMRVNPKLPVLCTLFQ